MMEVLAALFETEKELTDSKFRLEGGSDVSCLVPFHLCGQLDNEKHQQQETRYTLAIYVQTRS